MSSILQIIRKHPVWLLITHKFSRIEPKRDVGESGEPARQARSMNKLSFDSASHFLEYSLGTVS
jgi:hypothetical protein